MKAARRQELKTNELSVYLQQITDYLRDHSAKVTLFAVLAVLLVGAVIYRLQSNLQTLTNGWDAYYATIQQAPDPNNPNWVDDTVAQWEQVIATYNNERIKSSSVWALAQFCQQQASSSDAREDKARLLAKAEANCQRIVSDYRTNVTLYGAALLELATIAQDRYALDPDPQHKDTSRGYLERILNEEAFRGSPLRSEVRMRLDGFDQLWTPLTLVEPPIVDLEGPIDLPGEAAPLDEESSEASSEASDDPAAALEQTDSEAETESPAPSEPDADSPKQADDGR